ncbi:hypothetical protein GQ457_12G004820 [Hibiscus cannabinus]
MDMMINRARALLRWRWRWRWHSHDIEHGSAIPEPTTELLTALDRPSRQVTVTLCDYSLMCLGEFGSVLSTWGGSSVQSCILVNRAHPCLTPLANVVGCVIYEVPYRLRQVKEIAYEPNVISIGPYHHDKPHLKAMEVIKRKCFDQILEVTKLESSEFIKAMEALEERVRECYEGPIDHCDKFVEMMVYDGCFLVLLIRNIYPLDCMIMRKGEGNLDDFTCSALTAFQKGMHGTHIWSGNGSNTSQTKDAKHLLDLLHSCCRPSPQGIRQQQNFKAKAIQKSDRSWKFIRSATELEDAGINFLGGKVLQDHDQAQGVQSMFDITFTTDTKVLKLKIPTKVLKTPTLRVDDNTERLLRNFMAYEQFTQMEEPTYVSDYVVFMDDLINTGKDVQLLCNSGIIDNWLGDDEVVAQMFNKLRDYVCFTEDFYYAETFVRVNKHCQRKWSKYKAILKKDYFNSPWSLCSFLAAVVLLLMTLDVGTGHHLKKWPCQSRSGQRLHVPSMDLAAAVFCLVSENPLLDLDLEYVPAFQEAVDLEQQTYADQPRLVDQYSAFDHVLELQTFVVLEHCAIVSHLSLLDLIHFQQQKIASL